MVNQKFYVCMTDKFMSGWGRAENKINKLCIECDNYEQAKIIERNAKKRGEMEYININLNKAKDTRRCLVILKHFNEMGGIWRIKETIDEYDKQTNDFLKKKIKKEMMR